MTLASLRIELLRGQRLTPVRLPLQDDTASFRAADIRYELSAPNAKLNLAVSCGSGGVGTVFRGVLWASELRGVPPRVNCLPH